MSELGLDHAFIARIPSLGWVFERLQDTHDRGVHVLDDESGAVVFTSYASIVSRARRVATRLAEHGIAGGDFVLFSARTTPRFPDVWVALQWIGAIPVPMPPREALVGQYTFKQRLGGIVPHFRYYLCTPEERADILEVREQDGPLQVIDLRQLLSDSESAVPHGKRCRRDNKAAAFVQFTSGSTSQPKGILVTYENLFANVYSIWARLAVDPLRHRFISWLPLYHDMGLVGKFLGCLCSQTDLVLMSPQHFAKRPLKFLELVTQYRPQVCSMPNFALEWILRRLKAAKDPQYDLSSMTWFGIGAEPIHPETVRNIQRELGGFGLTDKAISPCYGLAEATLAVTITPPGVPYGATHYQDREVMRVGPPVPDIEVKIDAEPGEAGRILVRGTSIAGEALIEGRKTSILDDQGYYDTKDVGFFEGGDLVVLGRADEAFIRNGENYFPYDIEAAVREMDGVLRNRVVCFGVPKTDSHGVDVVVLIESRPLPQDERASLATSVEAHVVRFLGLRVDRVLAVPPKSIPVTPSGKLQRQQARALYADGLYEEKGKVVVAL